jgi:hypothetical protein
MLYYYSAIFRCIALCYSIFGLIPDLQAEDLYRRVEQFKESYLKIVPRDFEMFINRNLEDEQEEDIESWEVVYKAATQRTQPPLSHQKSRFLQTKSRDFQESQEVEPPIAKRSPSSLSQVHPITEKQATPIAKEPGYVPPQGYSSESPEDFPLKESREATQKAGRNNMLPDASSKQAPGLKQSKSKQQNKVITSKKSRVIYSTGQRHEDYRDRDAPADADAQEEDKSNKIYRGTQSYYPGLLVRLACTGVVLFPVPIVIIFMDYTIYSEYTFQADFLNRNMEIRSSLHYLNALNYELISTGVKPTGRTVQQPNEEVDLVEHIIRHEDTTLAKYMAYSVSDFPSYLREPIEKFLRYSQGDICQMGGLTFISYLNSCSRISASLQLLKHSPERIRPGNIDCTFASQKRLDLGYEPAESSRSRPGRREG